MAPSNTKNVPRTNFLLGHTWGEDLVYDEMVMTTIGDAGKAMAEAMAKANPFGESTLQPGEGPSKEEREKGLYDIVFIGDNPDGTRSSEKSAVGRAGGSPCNCRWPTNTEQKKKNYRHRRNNK